MNIYILVGRSKEETDNYENCVSIDPTDLHVTALSYLSEVESNLDRDIVMTIDGFSLDKITEYYRGLEDLGWNVILDMDGFNKFDIREHGVGDEYISKRT